MLLKKMSIAVGLAIVASHTLADSSAATNFDEFTPMVGNTVPGALPESAPFLLSSGDFRQVTIVARDTLQIDRFDSGNYDMHTVNENGVEAGPLGGRQSEPPQRPQEAAVYSRFLTPCNPAPIIEIKARARSPRATTLDTLPVSAPILPCACGRSPASSVRHRKR